MEGPRSPSKTEFETLVRFLNSHLRPGATWSVPDEYPLALNTANLHNIRIMTEGQEILSHALLRPLILKTPAGLFKVAGIGSVVTHTQYRSQGLSTQVLEDCLAAAKEQACDLAILWTDLFDFYRRLGFELAGTELTFQIQGELPAAENPGLKFVTGTKIDPAALHRLYGQHTVTSLRTIEDFRRYLEIPNSRIYTAWDAQGLLQAYAVEGKGADLQGYIHEWGGGVSKLLPLLNFIYQQTRKPLRMIVPSHSQSLIRRFQEMGMDPHPGHLGMIKMVNPQGLFSRISRFARGSLGIPEFILEKTHTGFAIGIKDHIYQTSDEKELTRILFGPGRPSENVKIPAEARPVLDLIFPLRLWIWGWDSV